MRKSEELEIRIKYHNQHIEWLERTLSNDRTYRDKLQMELNRARRLEREELQDDRDS